MARTSTHYDHWHDRSCRAARLSAAVPRHVRWRVPCRAAHGEDPSVTFTPPPICGAGPRVSPPLCPGLAARPACLRHCPLFLATWARCVLPNARNACAARQSAQGVRTRTGGAASPRWEVRLRLSCPMAEPMDSSASAVTVSRSRGVPSKRSDATARVNANLSSELARLCLVHQIKNFNITLDVLECWKRFLILIKKLIT